MFKLRNHILNVQKCFYLIFRLCASIFNATGDTKKGVLSEYTGLLYHTLNKEDLI